MGPCSHSRAPGFLGPWSSRGPLREQVTSSRAKSWVRACLTVMQSRSARSVSSYHVRACFMNMIEEYDADLALLGWLKSKKSRSQGFTSHTAFRICGAKLCLCSCCLQGHNQASWIKCDQITLETCLVGMGAKPKKYRTQIRELGCDIYSFSKPQHIGTTKLWPLVFA